MEDSQTARLDEVEQELVQLLSLRADDLQILTSRQDQLLQSHYHSLNSVLQTARLHFDRLKTKPLPLDPQDIRDHWLERQNLKRLWGHCEEQKQKQIQQQVRVKDISNNIPDALNDQNRILTNNYFKFNISNTSLSELSLN